MATKNIFILFIFIFIISACKSPNDPNQGETIKVKDDIPEGFSEITKEEYSTLKSIAKMKQDLFFEAASNDLAGSIFVGYIPSDNALYITSTDTYGSFDFYSVEIVSAVNVNDSSDVSYYKKEKPIVLDTSIVNSGAFDDTLNNKELYNKISNPTSSDFVSTNLRPTLSSFSLKIVNKLGKTRYNESLK